MSWCMMVDGLMNGRIEHQKNIKKWELRKNVKWNGAIGELPVEGGAFKPSVHYINTLKD